MAKVLKGLGVSKWRRGRDSNPRSPPSSAATTPPATTCHPYRAGPATASDCARWEHGIRRELRRYAICTDPKIAKPWQAASRVPRQRLIQMWYEAWYERCEIGAG